MKEWKRLLLLDLKSIVWNFRHPIIWVLSFFPFSDNDKILSLQERNFDRPNSYVTWYARKKAWKNRKNG